MATPIAFESSWVKKEEKQILKEARQEYLEKAKEKYDREERRRELSRQRGEGTWMLDSVTQRIQQETQALTKKTKKHKKEKKRKKVKKEKNKKKKDFSSGSDPDSDDEKVWVEQGEKNEEKPECSAKGPQLQRDSWMESPLDLIPTVTRDELRKAKIAQDKAEKSEVSLLDQPGHHPRELNPFWRDGGTGLPEEKHSAGHKSHSSPPRGGNSDREQSKGGNCNVKIGDGGATWLRKAYQRCQQLAVEEDRSLEEVAEERYGSLERLQKMLADAEEKEENLKRGGPFSVKRSNKRSFMRPRSRSRSRSRSHSRSKDRHRSRSKEIHGSRSRHRSRSRDHKSRDRHRSRSRDQQRSRNKSRSRSKDRSRSRDRKSKFLRPSDNDDIMLSGSRPNSRSDSAPAWKKKGFIKPSEEQSAEGETKTSKEESQKRTNRERREPSQEAAVKSSDSSSDSSSSEDDTPATVVSPEPVLTEQQLNELGAKILRAEIMGDEDLASSLKSKLTSAQKVREEQKSNPGKMDKSAAEEDVVVLTRADKRGMVRPLPDRKHPIEPKGGRRKAGKTQTHSDEGHRQKYFDDDDKYDLKTLVEREKMGTAEDQNAMFARLAGRAAEKTDDDFQMDDLLIKNATRKQNDSHLEERERTLAITEHKKMSAALDRCHFCFEKVAKHLIIAIGTKVYVCLPNQRSLTEGHCLIVPMQHVSCATDLDEEVWTEIQTFRKSLTKMFEAQELDCVFMESAMYLKKQPHMSLECVPLPRELGDVAPLYFKKALLECESEWAQNKKVVDISQKDIRRSIPKGFPYFSVDFGLQGGFAHVIEDQQKFTTYFGKEVVGGMMDVEPRLWRKPVKENFDDQRKKVLQFADWWKPFDWTLNMDK